MEKKNNSLVIILMGVIIVILAVLCVLFATDTITLNTKENSLNTLENNNSVENNQSDNVEEMTNENAIKLLKEYGKRIFDYVHSLGVYCGDNMKWNNESDYIPYENADYLHLYDVSQDFKSKSELEDYLKKYLSSNIIEKYNRDGKYLYDTYKEKDNKLYCLNSNKDCGMMYRESDTTYEIESLSNDKIIANAKIYFDSCGENNTPVSSKIIIEKDSNNSWIVTQYEETN